MNKTRKTYRLSVIEQSLDLVKIEDQNSEMLSSLLNSYQAKLRKVLKKNKQIKS